MLLLYCTHQNTTIKMAGDRTYGYSIIYEGSNIWGVPVLKKKPAAGSGSTVHSSLLLPDNDLRDKLQHSEGYSTFLLFKVQHRQTAVIPVVLSFASGNTGEKDNFTNMECVNWVGAQFPVNPAGLKTPQHSYQRRPGDAQQLLGLKGNPWHLEFWVVFNQRAMWETRLDRSVHLLIEASTQTLMSQPV